MHPTLQNIQITLDEIKKKTTDNSVIKDIKKVLSSLEKKIIPPRLIAIFHPESNLSLSYLYKNEIKNEVKDADIAMSNIFNSLNEIKEDPGIFDDNNDDFHGSDTKDTKSKGKQKTDEELDKEMSKKVKNWYWFGKTFESRMENYKQSLQEKKQLLERAPYIVLYLDSLTKNNLGENYNAPLFKQCIEVMKDILDSDYEPKKFPQELECALYDQWYKKIKTIQLKDGLAGRHELQHITLQTLWVYANKKIDLSNYKYYTHKNPLAVEHMFRETLLNNFSNNLKKLIENINIDIQKDKFNCDEKEFQQNYKDYFKNNNEFKLFKLWMLYERESGNLDKGADHVLDPYTYNNLIRIYRANKLKYVSSTFLHEINNAPIKSQIHLYPQVINNKFFSADKIDHLQEQLCDLDIFLEEQLNIAMKLCNMLRIDHPKYNSELLKILDLFTKKLKPLIMSPMTKQHIYFEKNTDIKGACEELVSMVEGIKSISDELEKKCLEIDPKSGIPPQVQDETKSIFAKILDILYKIIDTIKYILGIDNLKAPIYYESLNSLRDNESKINDSVNNFKRFCGA